MTSIASPADPDDDDLRILRAGALTHNQAIHWKRRQINHIERGWTIGQEFNTNELSSGVDLLCAIRFRIGAAIGFVGGVGFSVLVGAAIYAFMR